QAKEQAQASWQGSFQHPFITELHERTLSPTIFRYYLIQDHYYLKHFSHLYRLIGAQTQQPRLKKLLLTNAESLALGE
ncbi:thiaminase II, partial [Enterococcus faecalis]